MSRKMASVADLVEPAELSRLATPSNLRLGQALAEQGHVMLDELGPRRVTARVSGGETRRVELDATPDGLAWSCTCTRRPLFCKHCVAVAVVACDKAPRRRGAA